MSLINISNLTFSYGNGYDNIFENISFQIDTDWRLGFTGRNGRGKTTFLKLLMGKYEYSGTISSSTKFLYFPPDVSDITKANKSTADVVRSVSGDFETWELERELSLLSIDSEVLDRQFKTLSNGEQTKVLLAALFLSDNGFLLIDEPTNHLDAAARQIAGKYLRTKKGFILVSHDRFFLDSCIDHILSINRASIDIQKGNFSSWLENKQRQDCFENAQNERLKKEIKRLKSASRQAGEWSDSAEKTKYGTRNSGLRPDRGYIGSKSAKMMKKSKMIEKKRENLADEKSLLLKNTEEAEALKIRPVEYFSLKLASFVNVSVFYGEKRVFEGVSFDIEQGDRIALRGRNGSGKSSIVRLICKDDISYTGTVTVPANLIVSYVSQNTSHLRGKLSDYAEDMGIDGNLFRAILAKLGFSAIQFEKNIEDFSEGQKKKVLIAKSLCQQAHLYVWDEPLNFIDLISRIQIEELLLKYKPTMVFVEHDRAFSESVATRTVDI